MPKSPIILSVMILLALSVVVMFEPRSAAAVSAATTGTIAYVIPNDTTGDQIWLAEPDGSNKRKIYSTGKADPNGVLGISRLAWRPDAGELVWASNHEHGCSVYESDLYAIYVNGSGYRRITNGPDCAALANYPQGKVVISAASGSWYQMYIQGAPEIKSILGGTATFDNVADLGSNRQPAVAISGAYRAMTDPIDVKAGQTVNVTVNIYSGNNDTHGAYRPVWRSDGSRIGYSFGCAALFRIADQPPVGTYGDMILGSTDGVNPCVMAWGSTPDTANQIVYAVNTPGEMGIYRFTEDKPSEREQLVAMDMPETVWVLDLEYLPDASGLIFSKVDNGGYSSNLYRYSFSTRDVTPLTNYSDMFARDFAISPDGQKVIFELAPSDWGGLWGGASDLYMMDLSGSTPQLFVAGGAYPSWSLRAPQLPGPTPTATVPSSSSTLPYKLYLPLTLR